MPGSLSWVNAPARVPGLFTIAPATAGRCPAGIQVGVLSGDAWLLPGILLAASPDRRCTNRCATRAGGLPWPTRRTSGSSVVSSGHPSARPWPATTRRLLQLFRMQPSWPSASGPPPQAAPAGQPQVAAPIARTPTSQSASPSPGPALAASRRPQAVRATRRRSRLQAVPDDRGPGGRGRGPAAPSATLPTRGQAGAAVQAPTPWGEGKHDHRHSGCHRQRNQPRRDRPRWGL